MPRATAAKEVLEFAWSYVEGCRAKLVGVIALETMLMSITGVGLLMILPLLSLLGMGETSDKNPIWRALQSLVGVFGLDLTLGVGLTMFVGVIVLRALLGWRRDTWQVDVEQRFQMAMRIRLYTALASAELYRLQQLHTSEFIQSTQVEIRQAQRAANILFRLFSQCLNLAAYFAVAVILAPGMTFFAVVCGVLGALLLVPMVKRTHALSTQQVSVRSRMLSNLIEHVQGVRTARVLDLSDKFLEDFEERCRDAADGSSRLTRIASTSTLAFEVVAVLLLSGFVYAGLTYFDVEATVFVVLLVIFIRIFPAIGELQGQIQQFVSNLPSFRHYLDLLGDLERHREVHPNAVDESRVIMNHSIALRDLSFRYRADAPYVLEDVSVTIKKGSLTAIGGESGAGKSTLIDLASGLLPPTRGTIAVDGEVLSDPDRVRWRREVCIVPQEGFLFDETIRDNLTCMRPNATESDLWAALETVNARAFVEGKADGLDTRVGERGVLLSGGERQRLSIARALLRSPQLLVLDEPTNNLDAGSEDALFEAVEKLKRVTTLLIVSHDQRLLDRADYRYRLEKGKLIAETSRPRLNEPVEAS